jgi:nucleotide-binding universal stress UspA family protein
MIRTILVPLDGSPLAEQALGPACTLARQTGAGIVLLRAAPFGADSTSTVSPLRVTKQVVRDYLETVRARLREQGFGVDVEALHMDPVGAITYAARMRGADLIVMSTHGHTGFKKLFLGSVAEQVLQQTTTPSVFIRACCEPPPKMMTACKRILVPLDGTPFSETALAFVAREGLADGNYVKLVYMVPTVRIPFTEGGTDFTPSIQIEAGQMEVEQRIFEARQYLARAAEQCLPGTMPHFQVVVEHAAKAILDIAAVQSIDMIAMATHARSGFDRLTHGSVARTVLHHATVPVLLLHGVDVMAHANGKVAVATSMAEESIHAPAGSAMEVH